MSLSTGSLSLFAGAVIVSAVGGASRPERLAAQSDRGKAPPGMSVEARLEDVSTLDGIIRAYYEVVSGPAGETPDRERDRSLHHPDALVSIAGTNADGQPILRTMTLDEYHDLSGGPRSEGFYEVEIHREVQRFGNVVHVWSTYASSTTPDGEPFTRGINSIQLFFDGERWWITSWIFDGTPGLRVPGRYLP
jgi:hypothetical protein